MEHSTILVVGGTGFVGSEICRQLRAKNLPVKAMVRTTTDPAKIEQLTKLGVQVVQGDIRNQESHSIALQGVTTMVSTVSSMPFSYQPSENDIQKVDLEGMKNLIDVAKTAGVKHFIYTSFSGQIVMDFPLERAKRSVEQYLQKSGMVFTILRPSYFMETWLSAAVGFDALNGKVNVFGSGANPIGYISVRDVAQFAVESISNPVLKNTILELGGPQNISQLEVVKLFEESLGKKIEVHHVPVDALQAQFDNSNDPMQKSFAALMILAAKGDAIDMDIPLKAFPIKLTSVQEFIRSAIPVS